MVLWCAQFKSNMLTQLLIIQVATFVGLIFVLRMLFYQHLNSALKRLKALHEGNLIKETQLKEELERAKKERLSEVEKGRQEAGAIIETAKKEAEAIRARLQEQTEEQTGAMLRQGKEAIEKLKAELLSEIEERALTLCHQMIQYVFTQVGKEGLQHQFIEELLEELEHIENGRLPRGVDRVKVTSCFPLTEQERKRLTQILSDKIGSLVILEEQSSPVLITGLVVEVGSLVIDGSLRNRLKKIIPYLKK